MPASPLRPLRPGQELEIAVEKLAFGGRGLARHEGFVVFIERGLPGQTVAARITGVKKGFAEAKAVRVLTQSPDRVEPFCPHFGVCGGCDWQDLAYPAQLHWKRVHVAESLSRLANLHDIDVAQTVPSPKTRHFRNKMEFAFAGNLYLGLHERDNPRRIFDATHCSLMSDFSMELLAEARAFCKTTGIAAYHAGTGKGLWRHLVMREGKATGQTMVQCITAPAPEAEKTVLALGERLMKAFPALTSFVHSLRGAKTAVAQGEKTVFTLGQKSIEERIGGKICRVSPDSFLQTNTEAADALYRLVEDGAALTGSETVWDLYAGSGGVALRLASRAKRVTGVEASRTAVNDAKEAAGVNGAVNCEFLRGDALETLASLGQDETNAPDVVILDPPRGGTHPDLMRALGEISPRRIVYVSCNPSTLARDIAGLAEAYRIESVTPVDLFPHSPHVETVLVLVKMS